MTSLLSTRTTRTYLALASMTLALAGTASVGLAQGGLPDAIIRVQGQLNAGDMGRVQNFVQEQVKGLSGTPEQIMASRRQLLAPVSSERQATVAFRLAYMDQLVGPLREILRRPDDVANEMAKVNALVVAAEVATPDVRTLIALGRESRLASVRFQAALAAERVFAVCAAELARGATAPMISANLSDLIGVTGAAMGTEADVLVVDKLANALVRAAGLQEHREAALVALDAGLVSASKRFKGGSSGGADGGGSFITLAQSITRSADQVRQMLVQLNPVPSGLQKPSGGIAATAIWFGRQHVNDAENGDREAVAKLAGAGESLAAIVSAGTTPANLSKLVRDEDAKAPAELQKFFDGVVQRHGIAAARYN